MIQLEYFICISLSLYLFFFSFLLLTLLRNGTTQLSCSCVLVGRDGSRCLLVTSASLFAPFLGNATGDAIPSLETEVQIDIMFEVARFFSRFRICRSLMKCLAVLREGVRAGETARNYPHRVL
jgi:hypothetical protein